MIHTYQNIRGIVSSLQSPILALSKELAYIRSGTMVKKTFFICKSLRLEFGRQALITQIK